MTKILYFIKIPGERLIFELEDTILSVSAIPTDGRTGLWTQLIIETASLFKNPTRGQNF